MTRDPVTVPWNYTVGEAAEMLLKHDISGVPVIDRHGRLVGIITKGDLFRALVPLTGAGKKGVQFALRVRDRRGAIKEITDMVREYGGRIKSVLTEYEHATQGFINVYLRTYGIDRKELQTLTKKILEKATIRYLVDHRENIREFYDGTNL